MVLRKPYAFFIKHFKLIHMILAILISYIALKTAGTLSFFNEYLQSTATVIDNSVAGELFPAFLYVVLVIILVMYVGILLLMRFKKKAILFYIVNIVHTIYTIFVLVYANSIVKDLELGLVEIRTLKLVKDLLVIAFIFESIGIILTALRALGFDIKKFEFGKDVDLQINELDREEFELDVNFDTDSFKRKWKRNVRNFKYVYKENKSMIFMVTIIIVGIVSGYLYWHFSIYNKMNKEGTVLRTNELMFGVVDTYATKKDYKGTTINDFSFVIVKIKVKNVSGKTLKLETGRIGLILDKMVYYPTINYQTRFYDLGDVYVTDEIPADKFKTYILVYEVPTSLLNKNKKILRYSDSASNQIKIKLDIEDIDSDLKKQTISTNQTISLENSILKGSKLTIKQSEIKDYFKDTYRFCASQNNCVMSYEYVNPNLNTNYDKSLLKIDADYTFGAKLDIVNASRLGDLFSNYGSIIYTLNGMTKTANLTEVRPTKVIPSTYTYLEVPREVKNASSIQFKLHIRNQEYVYKIK